MESSAIIRLRSGDKVLGYRRSEGESYYYSSNMNSWSGGEISFDNHDRFTGFKDKNNRMLFENDIIRFRDNGEELVYQIEYDDKLDRFFLKEYQGDEILPEAWLSDQQHTNKIEWISYTFIQNF